MVNTLKLKGRMAELGLVQRDIAKELGISTSTVSQKLNNVRPMSLGEAEKIAELLNLKNDEFVAFFFT